MTAAYGNSNGVLEDVRRALGRTATVTPDALEPFAEALAKADPDSILERFVNEVQAVRGSVHVVTTSQLVPAILDIQSLVSAEVAISGSSFLNDLAVSNQLSAKGLTVFNATGIEHDELASRLESAAAGITGVDYALAETGTLAVSSDEPNALLVSLLPPVHIAVLRRSQIFSTLDEVIERIGQQLLERKAAGRSTSFITGPSRTSDVELVLSIGVHGPKELHVIVLDD